MNTNSTHGMSNTKVYRCWANMIQRCQNPKAKHWEIYGGAGVKICDRWLNFESFFNDMGDLPSSKHTIDRKDPKQGYEPHNCVWATKYDQNQHLSSAIMVVLNGETMNLKAAAKKVGLHYNTVHERVKYMGWSPEKALTTKPLTKNKFSKTSAT